MSLDPLDPEADDEEGIDVEEGFCPSVNGIGPHDYRPVIDVLGGGGLILFCSQCGDYFGILGTGGGQSSVAPATNAGGTATTPPSGTPPSGTPGWP